MWKLNDIALSTYGIIPGEIDGENLAVKGIFDLPKRIGTTYKDWDDQDSVQPYVDADELFFEGRNILFHGIIEGTKAETEYNIEWLKLDISGFNSVVPFETPYGTYCVYVKQITPKIHNGLATIIIEFREPEVGASCSLSSGEETTYYSAVYNETAIKNNCPSGYHGLEVSLSSTLGQFTSIISQSAANQLAIDWVRENKQNNANAAIEGTYCVVNPPIYYNEEQIGSLQKNDCGSSYSGSVVTYTVEKETHSSYISIEDANSKALAELNTVLTQEYANANGTCSLLPYFKLTYNYSDGNIRQERLEVGTAVIEGTIYTIYIFSVAVRYTAGALDSSADVINALISGVNSVSAAEWNTYYRAPQSGTPGFPPYASSYSTNSISIQTSNYGFATPFITIP